MEFGYVVTTSGMILFYIVLMILIMYMTLPLVLTDDDVGCYDDTDDDYDDNYGTRKLL